MSSPVRVLDCRPSIEGADVGAAVAFWTDTVGLDVEATTGTPPVFAVVAHRGGPLVAFGEALPA